MSDVSIKLIDKTNDLWVVQRTKGTLGRIVFNEKQMYELGRLMAEAGFIPEKEEVTHE